MSPDETVLRSPAARLGADEKGGRKYWESTRPAWAPTCCTAGTSRVSGFQDECDLFAREQNTHCGVGLLSIPGRLRSHLARWIASVAHCPQGLRPARPQGVTQTSPGESWRDWIHGLVTHWGTDSQTERWESSGNERRGDIRGP